MPIPLRYRIVRRLLRIWFAVVFRKIRLLGAVDEAECEATVLLVSHPPRILDLLLLVASFDRRLHCLIDPRAMTGLGRQFLTWSLGLIPDARSVEGSNRPGIEVCRELLEREETVVIFAGPHAAGGNPSERLVVVAKMALEVESKPAVPLETAILAVHLLIPLARFNEALIHFGVPVSPRDSLSQSAVLDPQASELVLALSRACQANPFALRQQDLAQVLGDLAEILRSELANEWASRSNWKQTVEGFTLSRFVAEWAEQTNRLDPDKLVALREGLEAYREARRRWSLRSIAMESAGWTRSSLRRTLAWSESVLGLLVACYGFLNHLPAGLVVSVTGLGRKLRKRARPVEWVAAALIVVACYAGAIAIANRWFGRSAAGYYAVTLPTSGAYLWRYAWLWRYRTRLLLQGLFAPAGDSRLRRMRRELFAQVEVARNVHAETLGVAH